MGGLLGAGGLAVNRGLEALRGKRLFGGSAAGEGLEETSLAPRRQDVDNGMVVGDNQTNGRRTTGNADDAFDMLDNRGLLEQSRELGETVTYRRVQGGQGTQSSQQRIVIDDNGKIYINRKDKNLNISIDNGEHSQYFLNKRPGADVYEFEMPKWFNDMVQEYIIPQAGYKNNPLNQGGSAPKLTDPTTPGMSVEFPVPWVEWIEEYATNGRIIKGGSNLWKN